MSKPRYAVIIQWSEEDQAYVACLPEWGPSCKTHGATYEEAAKNAGEVLEMLMAGHGADPAEAIPEPKLFQYPGANIVDLKENTAAKRQPAVA